MNRVFILAATLALLMPSGGWAAYLPAVPKRAGKPRLEVFGSRSRSALGDPAGNRMGMESWCPDPGIAVRFAKARTTRKKG